MIVVVSGVYRWKSFLLNKLAATGGAKIDQNKIFRVGHSVAACTMGIWFFDRPIRVVKRRCERRRDSSRFRGFG